MIKLGTKNGLSGYFWARISKNYCSIGNQHLRICLIANSGKKQKCLNLGAKIFYLGIFGLEYENNIVIFEISTFEFV